MSTVEQKSMQFFKDHTAYHRKEHIDCACGWKSPHCLKVDPRTAHAAHLVEALATAGKKIVDLPEVAADDITIGVVSALHDYGAIDIETSPGFVRIFESTGWYSAEAMTFLGSALIAVAAARVAEGGAA
ncbi:hypothetical protein GS532_07685 [Rhodococcus hoagii]|nr:hypothetical protein [Prescottella equi]